jgi:apolipoprotein N-acyltransferase
MITLCYPNKQILALTIITVFSLVLNLTYKEPAPPQGWVGVNTNIGWIKNSSDEYNHNKQLIEIISNLIGQDNIKVVLLPELVIGSWNEAIKNLWYKLAIKAKQRGITILLGGKQWMKEKEYTNGLITIGNEEDKLLINRVPVPISMWRPWSKTKAKAKSYWFDNGIYELAGKKVTTLICYEQLLVWPILHSMLYKPDIILASSNVWWAIDTNIPAILKEVVRAWGRLFGIPKLIARNK